MRKFFLLISFFLLTGVFLQAQVDVTFQVDMSVVEQLETFNPSTDTVFLRGSFNGWGDGVPMSDAGDLVYTVTLTGQAQNTDIFYKFFHQGGGGTWESDPNREINTGTAATLTVDPSFFNDHNPYTGVQSPVTFNVDMRLPAQGDFDPAADTVFVAGNFTNWGTDAVMMEDPETDTIFTVTIDVDSVVSGDKLIYKFIWSNGTRYWETNEEGDDIIPGTGGNRIYGVHDGANDVSRWWNNVNPTVQTGDGNIYFEVDMSVMTELNLFDPNVDSVQVRGGFNGWNDSDPERSLMNQNPANPDDWFLNVSMNHYVINSNQLYKFFIKNGSGSTPYSNTGWEVPIRTATNGSDRNRGVIFLADPAQEAPYSWFENINPDWVIPAGTTVECTFKVDMTNATNPDSQTVVFVPGVDTVWWIPRQPIYYALNGHPWPGGYPRDLELTDPDQDMIYEGTLTLTGPSYNGWLYNYAYSSGTDLVHEGDGSIVSQGDARVRFVGQSGGARMFDTPWTMPLDVWSNSPLPEEDHPQGWIDNVREIPGNPQTYSLEQNYPNPFNPSTTIRFSVPEQGLVSLKVFNLLGEQVATLVNSELAKGSYEINFKGYDYSSGIYFYTLKAGNFVSTKKMILLK